jgi:magnesium-transporting ATPase (P-type)
VRLLLRQLRSPLVAILVFAALVSALLGDWTDAAIVLAILIGSALLGFVQEHRASLALEELARARPCDRPARSREDVDRARGDRSRRRRPAERRQLGSGRRRGARGS